MKRMTKIVSLCLTAGSMLLAPLSADTCCTPQDCCNSDGGWELGLEFLYWKPCACAFEFAYVQTGQADVIIRQLQRVKPSNHPGWRLFATYAPCDSCFSYTIDWAYVRATDTSEVASPKSGSGRTLQAIPSDFRSVPILEAQQRAIYNRVNLRMNYLLHSGSCTQFYAYGGFRLLDFNLYRRVSGINAISNRALVTEVLRNHAQFSGAGIELGVGGRYDLGCCIGLVSNVGVTAAVGQQKYQSTFETIPASTSSRFREYSSQTHCVPGVDLRIGFDYEWACECLTAVFEIGYEINHYFGALRYQQDLSDSTNTTSCQNFGFAGPYASLRIAY